MIRKDKENQIETVKNKINRKSKENNDTKSKENNDTKLLRTIIGRLFA